jgi:hypothetical protein
MAKFGWCVPCGEERRDVEATVIVEDEPLCAMHARIAAAVEAGWAKPVEEVASDSGRSLLASAVCLRGCGNEPHRGQCKGLRARAEKALKDRGPMPEPMLDELAQAVEWDRIFSRPGVADAAAASVEESDMDVLVCEEIPASAVPSGRERNIGRLGQLWVKLLATPFDVALKVKCRDAGHAGSTARHMTLKARKAGIAIVSRKVGNVYFCHRVREEKAAR